MTTFVKPNRAGLLETLHMVVGDDASAKPCDSVDDSCFSYVAKFIDDDDKLVSACLADFKLSAAMGASLSMIGPAAVDDMVGEKKLTSTVEGNLYEVMNILSSLFMDDGTPHLRLSTVDEFSAGADEMADFERVDYEVDLGKYGSGALSFLTV